MDLITCRKGYYGAGRANWDTDPQPLAPNQATALTRRQDSQRTVLPNSADIKYKRVPDDADMALEIAKKNARLQRRARSQHRQAILRRKKEDHEQRTHDDPTSSESSSSESESD